MTIMKLDERIVNRREIQKIANRYRDVNKTEVKFRGKEPMNMEYEKKNRKWNLIQLIIEGTDITPLLEMDWMKRFKLPIRSIQLPDSTQSKMERFRQFSGLV